MDTLESLGARELQLLRSVQQLSGLIEEKEQQVLENGSYREAAAIQTAYVELASKAASDLEALKRAVFLGWFQDAEPGWLTGVGNLDPGSVARSLDLVERALADGRIDSEFRVMLQWYWQVAPWHFSAGQTPGLVDFASTLSKSAYKSYQFTVASLQNRGQMGEYWLSIAGLI